MTTNWIFLGRITHSDLSEAATSKTITYTAPFSKVGSSKIELENVRLNVTEKFIGGSISALTLAAGVSGDVDRFVDETDVFTNPIDVLGTSDGDVLLPEVLPRTQNVIVTATSTGANLSELTQGKAEIWCKVGALP